MWNADAYRHGGPGEIPTPSVMASYAESSEREVFFEEHAHRTHELLWKDDGAGLVVVGDHRWSIAPGLALWMPAGVLHSGWARAGTTTRSVHFSVDGVPPISDEPVAVQVTPLLGLLLERLGDLGLEQRSRELTEAMILDLLEPAPHRLRVTVPRSRVLAPIAEAVLADPRCDDSLTDWSSRLGVSTRTLTRRFVEETGAGYSEWVRSARVQQAIPLLLAGESIEAVALDVGYRSATAFGVAFRKEIGSSPGAYRNAVRPSSTVSDSLQNLS